MSTKEQLQDMAKKGTLVCPVCGEKHSSRAQANNCLLSYRDINPKIIEYYNFLPDYSANQIYPEYKILKTENHKEADNLLKKKDEIPTKCPMCGKMHYTKNTFEKCVEESRIYGGDLEKKTRLYYDHWKTSNKIKTMTSKTVNSKCPICNEKHSSRLRAERCWKKNKDNKRMEEYFRTLPDYSDDKRFLFPDEIELQEKLKEMQKIEKQEKEKANEGQGVLINNNLLTPEECKERYGLLIQREHETRQRITTMYEKREREGKIRKEENLLNNIQLKKRELLFKFPSKHIGVTVQ